jgi:hypothetical protein
VYISGEGLTGLYSGMCIDYKTGLLQVLLLVGRRRTDVLSLSSDHIRKGATAISESASL